MADALLRDELESFKRQFEMLQVGEAECHLVTTKTAILTRHPVRRVIVKCQTEPWDYWCMEGGIELLPERILNVQDLKDAVPLYDFDGKLVETPNGELMFKTGGWSVSHCFYFRGRGYRGISKLIERINLWACEHRRWLNRIGLIPPIAQKQGLHLWSEVVLSVAENSGSSSIAKPEWYVTVRPGLRINLKMLNRSACKGVFGVTQDEIDRLILEPQEVESSREDFVGDSIAVITELIKRSTQAESEPSPKVDADDGNRHDVLADGLSTDKRSFRWHGKTYTLGLVPSKVVELLHNRFLAGEYFVHEQFIKTEADVESDMRSIVRDNKLEDLIVRQKKTDGKTARGMWGLSQE